MMTMITKMTIWPGSECSFDPRPPPPRPLSCKNDPCPLNHQCCRFWSTSSSSTFFILQSPSTWSIWLPPALEGGLVVVTQTSDARREFVFDWNLIGKRSETTSRSVPVTFFSSVNQWVQHVHSCRICFKHQTVLYFTIKVLKSKRQKGDKIVQ